MSNTHALTTLLNLAEEAAEEAAKVLAQVRQTHTQMSQQLTMLENYQADYRQKLNQTLHTGWLPINGRTISSFWSPSN